MQLFYRIILLAIAKRSKEHDKDIWESINWLDENSGLKFKEIGRIGAKLSEKIVVQLVPKSDIEGCLWENKPTIKLITANWDIAITIPATPNPPLLHKATPNPPTNQPNPLLMVSKASHLPRPTQINATTKIIDISKLLKYEEVNDMVLKTKGVSGGLQSNCGVSLGA